VCTCVSCVLYGVCALSSNVLVCYVLRVCIGLCLCLVLCGRVAWCRVLTLRVCVLCVCIAYGVVFMHCLGMCLCVEGLGFRICSLGSRL